MTIALSYTRIALYNQCKSAYNRKYNLRQEEVANMAMLGGGLFHELAEMYGKHLSKKKQATDLDAIEEILKNVEVNVDYETFQDISNEFRDWAGNYIHDPAMESRFEMQLAFTQEWEQAEWFDKKKTVFLRAKIDRADMNGNPLGIIDYKTSRALPQQDLLQLRIYAFAMNLIMGGNRVFEVVEDFIRLHYQRKTILEYDDYKDIGDYLLRRGETMEKTKKWPEEVSSKCTYCGFKLSCKKYTLEISPTLLNVHNAEDAAVLAEKIYTLEDGFIKSGKEILKAFGTENGPAIFGDQAYASSEKGSLKFPQLKKAVLALREEGAEDRDIWNTLGLTKTNLTKLAKGMGYKGKKADEFVEQFADEHATINKWSEFRFKKATPEMLEAAKSKDAAEPGEKADPEAASDAVEDESAPLL